MEATSGRIDATKVIGEAFETYREHFGALIGAGDHRPRHRRGAINGVARRADSVILSLVGAIVSLVASVPLRRLRGQAGPGHP